MHPYIYTTLQSDSSPDSSLLKSVQHGEHLQFSTKHKTSNLTFCHVPSILQTRQKKALNEPSPIFCPVAYLRFVAILLPCLPLTTWVGKIEMDLACVRQHHGGAWNRGSYWLLPRASSLPRLLSGTDRTASDSIG